MDSVTICSGCGYEIDPEVCHCGDLIKMHSYGDGHSPVSMGCMCGYEVKPACKRSRVEQLTLPFDPAKGVRQPGDLLGVPSSGASSP